jgi:hypothetical protein
LQIVERCCVMNSVYIIRLWLANHRSEARRYDRRPNACPRRTIANHSLAKSLLSSRRGLQESDCARPALVSSRVRVVSCPNPHRPRASLPALDAIGDPPSHPNWHLSAAQRPGGPTPDRHLTQRTGARERHDRHDS